MVMGPLLSASEEDWSPLQVPAAQGRHQLLPCQPHAASERGTGQKGGVRAGSQCLRPELGLLGRPVLGTW